MEYWSNFEDDFTQNVGEQTIIDIVVSNQFLNKSKICIYMGMGWISEEEHTKNCTKC